jgi:hypothetical protein
MLASVDMPRRHRKYNINTMFSAPIILASTFCVEGALYKHSRIDPSLHVTGQIKPSQLREIADLGFKALICMRPDKEGFLQPSFEEVEEAARGVGLEA